MAHARLPRQGSDFPSQASRPAPPPSYGHNSPSDGQSLAPGTRATMSARFGHDFSSVRIHTDADAAASAQALGAAAFTQGQDIFFGDGFQPDSPANAPLLAHELTHVVQQAHHGSGDPGRVSAPQDAAEQEADALAAQVTAGRSVHVNAAPSAGISCSFLGQIRGGLSGAFHGIENEAENGLHTATGAVSHAAQAAGQVATNTVNTASNAGHSLANYTIHAAQDAEHQPLNTADHALNNGLRGYLQNLTSAAGTDIKDIRSLGRDPKTPREAGHGLISDAVTLAGDGIGLLTSIGNNDMVMAELGKFGVDSAQTWHDAKKQEELLAATGKGTAKEAGKTLGVDAKAMRSMAKEGVEAGTDVAKEGKFAKALRIAKVPGVSLLAAGVDGVTAEQEWKKGDRVDAGFQAAQAVGDVAMATGNPYAMAGGLAVDALAYGGQAFYDSYENLHNPDDKRSKGEKLINGLLTRNDRYDS